MKTYFTIKSSIVLIVFSICFVQQTVVAQICEWRLANATYNTTDPDGAGPATGFVTFTLQAHTVSGTVTNVNAISTGFSYQSSNAMIPTTPGCAIVSNPANITVSPYYVSGGFAYTTVNQCGIFSQSAGGQSFDRRAVGTMDGTNVTITTTWQDMFTVTLWTLGSSFPQGGRVIINSGAGGSPGEFTTYAISDADANEYVANSLTYNTPLELGGSLPVLFTKFEAKCNSNGTLISWATAQEQNSNRFEIERSENNGTDWKLVGTVQAAGNSSKDINYQQLDLSGGAALYRIKQIDNEGKFLYTAVERTNCQVKNTSIAIYPIPANNVLNVVIKSDKAVNTQFMIYDVSGKLVKRVSTSILNGNNNLRIDLTGLIAGQYLLRTNDPAIEINKVFIIAR